MISIPTPQDVLYPEYDPKRAEYLFDRWQIMRYIHDYNGKPITFFFRGRPSMSSRDLETLNYLLSSSGWMLTDQGEYMNITNWPMYTLEPLKIKYTWKQRWLYFLGVLRGTN